MAEKPVFLYAAVHDGIPDAESDYGAVFDLHRAGVIGTFDAAVIEKEIDADADDLKRELQAAEKSAA